jgi:hypothetical protein
MNYENLQNTQKPIHNTSGYKGVYYNEKAKKWIASICANKKRIHLGCFNTSKLAGDAYCKAAKKYHGKFANLGN